MRIAELCRYPVKSMAGERLERATRRERHRGRRRRLRPPRERPPDHVAHASEAAARASRALGADGDPRVDGLAWTDERVAAIVREIAGPRAALARAPGGAFDILPLLVATDGAIAAFGYDGRRLRPNIVVGDVAGLAERGWEGRALRVGEVVIGIEDLRGRCVMTTFDPDTQEQDASVLEKIVRDFDGTLALNCRVARGGTIALGDAVLLFESVEAALGRA